MVDLLDYFEDDATSTVILVTLSILIRVLTGLSSYSGAGDPPKYGDYEAQRHWMELTVNLPVTEWYTDSPANSATYWPLDYPPLSGYQSWLCGLLLRAAEPAAVALGTSRGYESATSKIAMRWTVIAADILIYIPACLLAVHIFYGPPAPAASAHPSAASRRRRARTLALFALLFNPALLLIDHGHFQYNGIGLGLAAGAAAAIAAGWPLCGSVLFVLALNHKHMGLFLAPAFFAHLLGWALHARGHRGVMAKALAVAKLGVTVIAVFAVCWAPYLSSKEAVLRVLTRIFPVRRGLYEDYVANWWCTTSLVVKWKSRFPAPVLLRVAASTTIAVAAPAMAHQIAGAGGRGRQPPSRWGLLRCMANSAFAFYMFSYQVHEKSILLPLLPVCLMAGRHPLLAAWLPLAAAFSMFPLLERDGVALPYVALCVLYGALMAAPALRHARELRATRRPSQTRGRLRNFSARLLWQLATDWALRYAELLWCGAVVVAVGLHVARLALPPPERLPWIHDRLAITAAFGSFALAAVYLQVSQWFAEEGVEEEDGEGGRGRGRTSEGDKEGGKRRRKVE